MANLPFLFGRIFTIMIILCIYRVACFSQSEIKQGDYQGEQIEYIENQICVKIRQNVDLQSVSALVSNYGGELISNFNRLRWGVIRLPQSSDIFPVIDSLKQSQLIEEAEPNGVGRAHYDPNDYYYGLGYQWNLYNYGQQPTGGTPGADIKARQAWDIATGNPDVIIAILDSGIPMLSGA
ncbi:MAG: hypothetical protein QME52_14460, partial [Bacteroidota bacterium]|nr:hypothetical protein [Bacteroidota bacterium]